MNFIKAFALHIVAIVLVVVGLFVLVSYTLNGFTRHGEHLTVPILTGLSVADAAHLLQEKKLRYVVLDSLYFDDKPKLSILEQNPAAKSLVKEGRVIYLTINSSNAPQVTLPLLKDMSLRQAEAILSAAGLKVGALIYKPDIAKDVVLEMQMFNTKLQAGKKISKGTAIDLVIGDGLNGELTAMPDLVGLTLNEANNLIASSSLTLGSVVYLGAIADSTTAKVVRQNPAFSSERTVSGGTPVDLFLKQ